MGTSNGLLAALLTASAAVVLAPSCQLTSEPGVGGSGEPLTRGESLYAQHCAVCHGDRGRGDGLPAGVLLPPARDFSLGLFSLVSTDNGVPTDTDLETVLRRGVPGSSMPSFSWLGRDDILALVDQVRVLTLAEMTTRVAEEAVSAETEEAIKREAASWFTPGRPVPQPRDVTPSPAVIERGKSIYLSKCAACHGEQGTGRRPIVNWVGRRTVNWARDFTLGIMKGDASHGALANRIQAGMPGAAMPPSSFADPGELEALVSYLDSLIPDGAADLLVQKMETIRVSRLEARSGLRLDDPRWDDVEEVPIVLSPLRWRDDSIVRAQVRVAQDGEAIFFKVSWQDATRDEPGLGELGPSDRVALQFTDEAEASFFAMGSATNPVNIWYWHPQPARLTAGVLDLVSPPHGTLTDISPVVAIPVRAQSLVARGPDSASEFGSQNNPVQVAARWRGGRWDVMFRRALEPDGEGLRFAASSDIRVAVSIWDGALSESPSDKSFSIWHTLDLR